jgi:hypothetical protein
MIPKVTTQRIIEGKPDFRHAAAAKIGAGKFGTLNQPNMAHGERIG